MFRKPVLQRGAWSRSALVAVVAVAVAVTTLTVHPAFAGPPTQQIEDFYEPDGTPVMSDDGMPFVHAALFRYSDQKKSRIMWQIMTQDLTPGPATTSGSRAPMTARTRGRSSGGSAARATPRGDLDAIGTVYTGPCGGFHRLVHESGRPALAGDHGRRRGGGPGRILPVIRPTADKQRPVKSCRPQASSPRPQAAAPRLARPGECPNSFPGRGGSARETPLRLR